MDREFNDRAMAENLIKHIGVQFRVSERSLSVFLEDEVDAGPCDSRRTTSGVVERTFRDEGFRDKGFEDKGFRDKGFRENLFTENRDKAKK